MELRLKTEEYDVAENDEQEMKQETAEPTKSTMYDGKRALEQMEQKRKKALFARAWHIFCWILEVIEFIVLFELAINNIIKGVIIWFVVFLFTRLMKRKAAEGDERVYRSYVSLYAEEFVPTIVRSLFDSAYYNYDTGFSRNEVEQMQIVQMGSEFHSEDYLKACYHGVHFRMSDVLIEDLDTSRGYLGDQYRTTLFSGIIYEFDFNKRFVCNMQIQDKNFISPARPLGGGRLEKVSMENTAFNKKYKTYTTNAHDAFYILTPQIMEQILKIGDKYLSMAMNFANQKLTIAINTPKGAFEPSKLTKKLDYEEEKEKIRREVLEIIEIVERLKLDNKLFL